MEIIILINATIVTLVVVKYVFFCIWWPYSMANIYAAPILGPTQIYAGLILWLTFMQPQCWTHVLKIIICNTFENGYSEAHHILVVCVSQFWTHILEIKILINATIVTSVVVKYALFCIWWPYFMAMLDTRTENNNV